MFAFPHLTSMFKNSHWSQAHRLAMLGFLFANFLAHAEITVPVATVQSRLVGSGFEMDGVIQPVKQSTVSAQVSGRLTAVTVKAGDKVRAGQLIATIDDREAQSGVQRSQAQAAQTQAELQNAQASFERTRDLQRQGFVSSAAMDTAQAQLKAAQAMRDQSSASMKQAGLSQGFTRVTAPFDAVVLQTLVDAGDLALPGTPLLVLYAPSPLRVIVQMPASRSKSLSGSKVIEIQLPTADGSQQWIRPSSISQLPGTDPVSQTIEWRLGLPPQTAQTQNPGQQVRVRFAAGQSRRLMVPSAAILHRGELTAVYVATATGFSLKAVRLGAAQGTQDVEVLAGLVEADKVALDPVAAGLRGATAASVAAQK